MVPVDRYCFNALLSSKVVDECVGKAGGARERVSVAVARINGIRERADSSPSSLWPILPSLSRKEKPLIQKKEYVSLSSKSTKKIQAYSD